MRILIGYDGSDCSDAALNDLKDAGMSEEAENPKDEIVEEAQSWGAHCVFVGAKGMRGVDRLLMGSVSSAVSARAHCSVEVVRVKAKYGDNS